MQSTPFPVHRTLTVEGKKYTIHPLTLDEMMVDLQAWVDRQFPDPFDVVNEQIERGRLVYDHEGKPDREPYPMAVQQFMLRLASERANAGRRLIGSPEADAKIQSASGVTELIYLSVKKGDPAFTREEARLLFKKMTVGQVAAVFQGTNLAEVVSDPKGPGTAGTPTA